MSKILSCRNLSKSFAQQNTQALDIFKDINLEIASSETISIVGSSGSGKTSLLQIMAGLDKPSSGRVLINNEDIAQLTPTQLCALRNRDLGFIYQFHHLLPEFTALENTMMPSIIAGIANDKNEHERANYILAKLGLDKRAHHYPNQLSGGERQRVAIARAVMNSPKLILADEPTGNLDNNTAHQVLEVFLELQTELKTSLVIVTHDYEIAAKMQKQYRLHNGKLESLNI